MTEEHVNRTTDPGRGPPAHASHTPAPWRVSPIAGENGGIAIEADDPADGLQFQVCEIWGIDCDTTIDDRAHANARLIAAAPDLLAALRDASDELEQYVDLQRKLDYIEYAADTQKILNAVNATIAKAEGRS